MTNIPFSGIREIFEECNRLEEQNRDIVHLEIGRPDFDTPQPIKDAAQDAIEAGHVHYTSNYGHPDLRDRLSEKLSAENGLEYDPSDEITVTAGATEAVFLTILALVDPGDEVLIPDPHWTYEPAIYTASGTPTTYDLDPEEDFQPDLQSIRDGITEDTKLLVINSPHNPTGTVFTEETLARIRDIAIQHDLLVLSDEIYEKIVYGGPHHSLAAFEGMHERTITVNGFSKAYSMTGWRLGYVAAPRELMDPIIRLRQYTSTCSSSISQHAGIRALSGDLHEPIVDAFTRRRDALVDRLNQIPEMSCPTPQGAFYAMPEIPSVADDDESFAWSLLREAGVATVPGRTFGAQGRGRVRIAYAVPVDRIHDAADRIESWIENQ